MTVTGPFVIGFNGPPRVGKDTIATHLVNTLDRLTDMPIQRQALAATMREGGFAILGMTQGGDKYYSHIKDQPMPLLGGNTFRQFMIDLSEKFVKPVYGQDFWSRLMHHRNQWWWDTVPTILIVTDIGFPAEVEFFCQNSRGYVNVRVDRPGDYTFQNDSRGYVSAQPYGGVDFALTNDDTPQAAAEEILKLISGRLKWPVL